MSPSPRDVTLPALTRDEAEMFCDRLEIAYTEKWGHRYRHDYGYGEGDFRREPTLQRVGPNHEDYQPLGALIERLHDHLAGQLCRPSLARRLAIYGGDHHQEVRRRQRAGTEA